MVGWVKGPGWLGMSDSSQSDIGMKPVTKTNVIVSRAHEIMILANFSVSENLSVYKLEKLSSMRLINTVFRESVLLNILILSHSTTNLAI